MDYNIQEDFMDWGVYMLDFASLSVPAKDSINYDSMGILEESYCTCFSITDGKRIPGASELVIKTVLEDIKQQSDITTSTLPKIFRHTNDVLSDFQKQDASPGGVSSAIMITDGEIAIWAHIGDCRIYHLQDNLLYEISPDHSDSYTRYEAGDIRFPSIRTDKLRYNLTHLMGLEQNFQPTFSKPTMVRKNDCFLICTDGFWENIQELQIEKSLKKSKTAHDWLLRMQKIVEKNIKNKKYTNFQDDYSAITIKI